MERLSALMDGELEEAEAEMELGRAKSDPALREAWDTYHLIGDALRGQADLSANVLAGVASSLADEPTVLAPRKRRQRPATRVALSLAASLCGVAVVGWLALYNNPFVTQPESSESARVTAGSAPAQAPVQVAAGPANSAMNDYLIAHQEFSPSTAMQGMVSYVRTVSARDASR
jgi:sigma-E factor negative regulatory protein RseA